MPLSSPKGASKNALRLKKVCYKVSLCENYQRQSCKAFIGLTNSAKIIGGGALVPEILDQSDRVGVKLPIFDIFSLVAPHVCENCRGQSCKAFIVLTIGVKMIGGGRPLLRKILSQSDRVGAKFKQ